MIEIKGWLQIQMSLIETDLRHRPKEYMKYEYPIIEISKHQE